VARVGYFTVPSIVYQVENSILNTHSTIAISDQKKQRKPICTLTQLVVK